MDPFITYLISGLIFCCVFLIIFIFQEIENTEFIIENDFDLYDDKLIKELFRR
jgi:hypothetical protein